MAAVGEARHHEGAHTSARRKEVVGNSKLHTKEDGGMFIKLKRRACVVWSKYVIGEKEQLLLFVGEYITLYLYLRGVVHFG